MKFRSVYGWELLAQLFITAVSNLAMVPVSWRAYNYSLYFEATLGLFAFTTSTMYHILQTLETKLYGSDDGHWHRADNVFAITVFCVIILGALQLEDLRVVEMLKMTIVGVAVIAQSIGPWDERFTFGPILLTFVLALAYSVVHRRKPPSVRKGSLLWSLPWFAGALVFFVLGLDDHNDWLRIYHGLWHVCSSAFIFCMLSALNPPSIVDRRAAVYYKYSHLPPLPSKTA